MQINKLKMQEYSIGISENRIGGLMNLYQTDTQILCKFTITPNQQFALQMTFLNRDN